MNTLTLFWIVLPLFVGFSIYLLPKLDRVLAITVALVSLGYGLWHVLNPTPVSWQLLDSFGVSLFIDGLSGFFILTNAVVTTAVILYCWQSEKGAFFYTQAIILHGSVNAVFVSADLISVYVALEVISIAAFLLIAYPRTNRSIWVGLRYLFVSNTAMLFYLLGAVLIYQSTNSFAFDGLATAPTEAIALIFIGLLTKGGIFVSGLWLPLTHSESDTPISALLSGVVVKTGVYPLVRFALMVPEVDPIVRIFGVATALLGVSYAVFSKDAKRILAFHTVSQLGFILAAPAVGGFYALTHGLVKSALFLAVGNLSSRDIKVLKQNPMPTQVWIALAIASFSISGFPLLAGFGAKVLTSKNLVPWQVIGMNLAAFGTAISFAKFIFLPHTPGLPTDKVKPGFWPAVVLLLSGLVLANGLYYDAYSLKNIVKPLLTIAAGWMAYFLIFQKLSIKLPRVAEQFDHLIGVMSLMLTLLFWMVLHEWPVSVVLP
ncbi:MAG: cation:proton antiporter [Cyanobacteria bacterium P01_B01_bin.77]